VVRRAAETIRQTVANEAKIIDGLLDPSRALTTQRIVEVGFEAHLPEPTSIDDLKALLTRLGIHAPTP
jgi:hypothetical protein